MASTSEALSQKLDKVKKSIEQFPAAASSLNTATTQLGQSIGQLDAILKRFSIGIPTWVLFNGSADTVPGYYHEDLGYAKIAGRWGIAVRTVSGDVRSEEGDRVEQWLLPDAPRFLGVQAIEKIPELLDAILENAAEMSKKMVEKANEVDFLASGISSVIDQLSKAKMNPPSPPRARKLTASQNAPQLSAAVADLELPSVSLGSPTDASEAVARLGLVAAEASKFADPAVIEAFNELAAANIANFTEEKDRW